MLTDREKEVLNLLAEGLDNKNIGKKLFISDNTAKTHVNNIFNKLGVNNRVQAVVQAIKQNIITIY